MALPTGRSALARFVILLVTWFAFGIVSLAAIQPLGAADVVSLAGATSTTPDGGLGAQSRSDVSPQGPSAGIHSRREPPDDAHP